MKIEFKAILETVQEVEELKSVTRQRIILKKPMYDGTTGEKIREDIFPAAILGDNIEKIKADEKLSEVVSVVAFLGSFKTEKDDKTYWNLSINVVELKLKTSK